MEKTSILPMTYRQTMEKEGCEIFHYFDRALYGVPLHHHDFYEVYYILRGETDYILEERCYHLCPGSLLLIAPHELHCPKDGGTGPIERFVLWVSIPQMIFLAERIPAINYILSKHRNRGSMLAVEKERQSALQTLFEALFHEQQEGGEHSNLMLKALLMQLFICFKRMAAEEDNMPDRVRLTNKSGAAPLYEVIDYIQQNIDSPLDVSSLARCFYYSPGTLTRHFKKYMGITAGEYIRKKRLAVARDLIMDGCTASEAGQRCGFGHYSTFYRAYVKEYGESPSEQIDASRQA